MAITIYDVAKLAGVSIATVSRVINKTGNVTPKTEEIVKNAMEKLNFSPSSLAQSFAKARSRTIGFIMPDVQYDKLKYNDIDSVYYIELFRGINSVLQLSEYSMLLINSKNNFANIVQEFLDPKKIEGLIIGSNVSFLKGVKEAIFQRKSIVYVGQIDGFNQGLHVYAQYNKYIEDLVNYFVLNGHRNIAYFGREKSKVFVGKLQEKLQLVDKKIIIKYYNISSTNIEEVQGKIKSVFSIKNKPTALFYEEFDKIQAVLGTLNEMNLKVPEDVSIISIEHKEGLGINCVPQITNVYVPAYEMGRLAAKLLIDYLNGKLDEYDQQFDLESKIIERESVSRMDR